MNKQYTLLIIEDSPEDQVIYQRYLSKASEQSINAIIKETGKEALEYVKKMAVDCILLDYQLPDMTGLEILKKLQSEEYPQLPIIMLTGQGNEKVAVEALKCGAYDYLIKGELQATQLNEAILNAIEKSELTKKLDQEKVENEFLAYHDTLTGLANRRQFEEFALHILSRAQRFQKTFAVFMLDLDGFKQVNDSKGHHAGDAVLKEVSRRFSNCLRKNDILGRIGGDEFSIILEDLALPDSAQIIAEKLIQSLEAPISLAEGMATISVSIGIAIYPKSGQSIPLLMKSADEALYKAKLSGKQTFRCAPPSSDMECKTKPEGES
jgi:diguanylate cyclase (GGDEF)-like protein